MDRVPWTPLLITGVGVVALQVVASRLLNIGAVSPNLCVLAVVTLAIAKGPLVGGVAGLALGLSLDLLATAQHTVGLWLLALGLGGVLAGFAHRNSHPSISSTALLAGWTSGVATSIFALLAITTGDLGVSVANLLRVVVGNAFYDLLLGAVLIWPALQALNQMWPDESHKSEMAIFDD
jgi:rod shape-determining protein MreD